MTIPLQSRFPRLWLVAQYLLCGVLHRKRYVLKHLPKNANVLEVGCSLGLDSVIFTNNSSKFLGVDIDAKAIDTARHRFAKYQHMRFICQDVRTLQGLDGHFNFILLCGSCHHISDIELINILRATANYLALDGVLVIVDYATNPSPGLLARFILALEEGRYVRSTPELTALVEAAGNLEVEDLEEFDNPAFLTTWPLMGRKLCMKITRKTSAS